MAQVKAWHLLAGTHLAAGLAGFALAEGEPLDHEVEHTGLFSADTKRTLAAAVLSLRDEHKLLVWTYRGAAHVSVERSELAGLLEGTQELTVPATVGYYLDLSDFGAEHVDWDEAAGVLMVRLPPLQMGEVALEPEAAVVRNGGLLTYSDRQVQELAKIGFRRARSTFIGQAQQASLVEAARRRARESVEMHFQVPLLATGHAGARVVATFEDR